MDQTKEVAKKFADILRTWLTEEEMRIVILRNAVKYKNAGICASHDFCDANMAMGEAFETFGLATTADIEDCDSTEYSIAQDLWNNAWTVAKAVDFDSSRIC